MNWSIFFFLIVFILMSCGKSEETPTVVTYTVETIEGVKHVHNHAPIWRDNPRISLELSMILGDDDTKGENYFFSLPWGVNKDSEGNIYILDRREYHVQKYDPRGNYLRTFGRRGQGTCEFRSSPRFLCLDTQVNLYIETGSYTDHYIIVINQEGKETKRIRFDMRENTFILGIEPRVLLMNESNQFIQNIYVWTKGDRNSENINPKATRNSEWFLKPYIRKYDIEGRFIREFEIEPFRIHDENFIASRNMNNLFYTIDRESNIYVTFKHINRIEKYSPKGKLLMRIDREKGFEQTKKFRKGRESLNVFSTSIGIDSKNRIWVTSLSRGELTVDEYKNNKGITGGRQFEVFDSDGILLCVIPWDNNISGYHEDFKIWIYDDKLYVVDSWSNAIVYEYKIVEK